MSSAVEGLAAMVLCPVCFRKSRLVLDGRPEGAVYQCSCCTIDSVFTRDAQPTLVMLDELKPFTFAIAAEGQYVWTDRTTTDGKHAPAHRVLHPDRN